MQKLILGVLLIGLLFITGCSLTTECPDCVCPECKSETCPECEEVPEEKALLDVALSAWGINEYNPNEILFDYYVYNYGSKEAKNVNIKCRVEDLTGKIIKTVTENVGNVASISYVFRETITTNPNLNVNTLEETIGLCYVTSCDNCEILYRRIPELREELK